MQEASASSDLTHQRWDVGIVGPTIDDRGNAATDFIRQNVDSIIRAEYNPENFTLKVDGATVVVDDLGDHVSGLAARSLIFEATTLGFVEILLFCRAFHDLNVLSTSFLYVEPERYTRGGSSTRRSLILHKRDFALSDEVLGYRAIPGSTLMLNDKDEQRTVFFLGFEERRLGLALEDYPMLQPPSCSVVFGVPAFKPGWEMDAFANNIGVIKEKGIQGGVYFCGAENPAAAAQVLELIQKELSPHERLFVAPIGTKPNGIGVALFAAANPSVGILYDHPHRHADRSSEVAGWHLYNATF
jgi:hypothetical protein